MHALLAKKWLLAIVAAGVIGSAAYAFAATLGITSGNLQAGNTTVSQCQAGSITATYVTAWDATLTPKSYGVDKVKLSNIDPNCVASVLSVSLTDGAGAQLGGGDVTSGAVTANDVTGGTPGFLLVSVAPTRHIAASAVNGIAVAVATP